jgi:hypothetical protein
VVDFTDRASYAVIARLPTHTEFWYVARIPEAGARIVHHGEEYDVESCEEVGRSRFIVRLVKTADSVAVVAP